MAPDPMINWAGNIEFSASQLHRPQTVGELQELVAASPRLHALGSAHSFSAVADSPGALVSLAKMIRNVGCSCRRFIILDVVRSSVPLSLFRIFIVPFVSRITAADGQSSIRRAYTPDEFAALVQEALAGTNATFRHTVAPFGVRQAVDISYPANLRAADKSDL